MPALLQSTNSTLTTSLLAGKNNVLWIFLGLFLMVGGGVLGQNNTIPTYIWESKVSLPTVNATLLPFKVNTEDLSISIATDSQGNVYTLTFGKGVSKRNSSGTLIEADFIPASKLDSPLDIAIDDDGLIYIADYFAGGETFEDNGKIWVFDSNGTLLTSKTILTSFYRPLGLDVDDGKVYVAEFNDGNSGPERNKLSRISVYDKVSGNRLLSTNNVNTPFRIAVDSQKKIYVSQAGNSNPSVRVFDQNLSYLNSISNIISPGSIVIDKFDFIHIIEYDGRIDFSRFIDFENLSFSEIQSIAKKIDDGQKADAFSIKVFNPNQVYLFSIKDKIDFPVDLTLNSCDKMYVLNSQIFGGNVFLVGYVPNKLEFDLEIYKRTPSFDSENPILEDCPADIVREVDAGKNYATISFPTPGATDNCSFTVTQTKGLLSGSQFPVGEHIIEFTVTNIAGNKDSCTFKITVNPAIPVGSPAVFMNCSNITADAAFNECGAIINYPVPTASDDEGKISVSRVSGPPPGEFFPVGITSVVYEATGSDGITRQCSFEITIVDKQKPVFPFCPSDITETASAGQNFAVVNYTPPNLTDNCSPPTTTRTGPASGDSFPLGTTTVTFTATDAAGNVEKCSFKVTVNPAEEPDPVTISCSGNETGNFGTDCRFQIPDYTGKATYTTGATITQTPAKGTFVTASTKIVLTATLNGQTDTCEFDLILSDNSPPDITSCPGSRTVTADVNGKFTIPDYTNEIIATDNCSSTVNITQFPAEGAVIDETTEIVFTVTDAGSNGASCSFTLTLAQQSATFANCTDNITRSNESGKCGAVVTFTKPTASDSNGNVEVIQTSGPASGSFFQVGASTLIFEATGSNGVKVECSFDVVVEDKEKPQFNNPCEGVDYTANFEVEEGFTVPNFFQQFGGTDNCDSEVSFQQDPAPGTMVFEEGSFPVNLTIRDDFGNFNTCSFTVTLTSSNSIDLSCNTQFLLEPDENCEFRLPDLSGEYIYGPSDAVVTQSVPQGEILTEDTDIKITVTDNGETLECTIKVILVDYVDPVLSCLPDQTVPFTPSQGYSLPNYISQLTYSDNCEVVSVTQQPVPGTVIRSNQIVQITVTDNFGNTSFCFIDVYLKEEGTPVEISCAEDITRNLDGNCGYLVPDLRNFATATEGATITQSPAEGMVISETQTIRLTATLDGVTDFCEFQLILVDSTPPQLNCPPDQVENFDPAIGFAVPVYTGMAGASDNCGVVEVVQTPTEGTTIFGTTEIKLTTKDQAGNVADCTFTLSLTEEEVLEITCIPDQSETLDGNCQFVIPDYTDQASVNYPSATITQSPEAGVVVTSDTSIVLTASLNGDTDICEFKILLEEDIEAPIANCILTGIFELGPNGTLTLPAEQIENNSTDNCGITGFTIDKTEFTTADIGENVITLTVTDTAGNMDTCQTTITIAPNENTGSNFSCVSQITLELDASGNANLKAEDLYSGDPGDRSFSLSKDVFNCSDLGTNSVTLTYTGNDGSGSCEINVEVVDRINPVLLTNNINVSLNAQGRATINPQLINNGSYDNCGEITFSLNKNTFTCKDIGENIISLRGEDSSGNISTVTATVIVTGNCTGIPGNPVDYIYIYPNPTPGPFTFEVPQGWIIEKAEVFDSRGRYLITQSFEGRSSYSMDLTGFQDAVYILLLYTNEGKKIVRVIIH